MLKNDWQVPANEAPVFFGVKCLCFLGSKIRVSGTCNGLCTLTLFI